MTALTFHQVTARVLRNPDLGNGKRGAPVEHIAALDVCPLWPLSAATLTEVDLQSPREHKETYHAVAAGGSLPDVREGDVLEIDGIGYPIAHVSEWTDRAVPCARIIVSEVKI